jgi:hypothetical protein
MFATFAMTGAGVMTSALTICAAFAESVAVDSGLGILRRFVRKQLALRCVTITGIQDIVEKFR